MGRVVSNQEQYRSIKQDFKDLLKKSSMKMFVENMNKVLTECPEDWERCIKNHPDLTVEITTEMARRQCSVSETPHYENVPLRSVQ